MTNNILDQIKTYKLEEIAASKAAHPLAEIEAQARSAGPIRPFAEALKAAVRTGYGLIAEIKKASPSKGLIRADFNPAQLATDYVAGGATCLSVLTDTPFFQGSKDDLREARAGCSLPVLRKDFLYDPYQVVESRALGADCILIILASLDDGLARELEATAMQWGMDVLIEVHDAAELDRAARLKSPLIGINNRDLRSFETTLETTTQLAKLVPPDRMIVSESGLSTAEELALLAAYGARAFLIGESLMRHHDVAAATRALLACPLIPGGGMP